MLSCGQWVPSHEWNEGIIYFTTSRGLDGQLARN